MAKHLSKDMTQCPKYITLNLNSNQGSNLFYLQRYEPIPGNIVYTVATVLKAQYFTPTWHFTSYLYTVDVTFVFEECTPTVYCKVYCIKKVMKYLVMINILHSQIAFSSTETGTLQIKHLN